MLDDAVLLDPPSLHPGRLGDLLGGLGDETLPALLQSCGRIQARLVQLIADRLPPLPPSAAAPATGAAFLSLSSNQLRTVACLAGAVWHAAALRRVIAAAEVAALAERLGSGTREFGSRNADLAVAPAGFEGDTPGLAAAVKAAGDACLATWLRELPLETRARASLRLPPGIEQHAMDAVTAAPVTAILGRIEQEIARHAG